MRKVVLFEDGVVTLRDWFVITVGEDGVDKLGGDGKVSEKKSRFSKFFVHFSLTISFCSLYLDYFFFAIEDRIE